MPIAIGSRSGYTVVIAKAFSCDEITLNFNVINSITMRVENDFLILWLVCCVVRRFI